MQRDISGFMLPPSTAPIESAGSSSLALGIPTIVLPLFQEAAFAHVNAWDIGQGPEPEAFDPRDVLDTVRATARDKARSKGLEIVVLPSFTVPNVVVGASTRVAQALLEYLDNAIRVTDQGRITLSAQLLGTDARGHLLRFAVADTGPGIAADARERLFTPFVAAGKGNDLANGRLGNGLATVLAMARALGGGAGAESVEGAGSTFWITGRFALGSIPAPANEESLFDGEEPLPTPEPASASYPTPNFVTLGEFDVDRDLLRGSFRVALDELLLPERFHFSPGETGWAEWVGPAAEPPEGDACEVPLYALDADTEAAISRALHSAVPRLVPAGRDPLSDEIRSLQGAVDGRAFDPGQFATGLGRLATPGFSITVSTLP